MVKKNAVLRKATQCSLLDVYWSFGGTFYLHHPAAQEGSSPFRTLVSVYQSNTVPHITREHYWIAVSLNKNSL